MQAYSSTSPKLPAGYRLVRLESVDSTNAEARRRAEHGEPGPLWIWSLRQSAGRGRNGRSWQSQPGNLFASLLLGLGCPLATATQLALLAGVAAYDTIAKLLPDAAEAELLLKWPNDVLIDGKKVAGILLESSGDAGVDALPWLAIGIGVNLVHPPAEAQYPATTVGAHGPAPSPAEALAELAEAWETRFRTWRVSGFAAIREAWLAVAAGLGQPIDVRLPSETLHGRFETLMTDGALSLLLPDGSRRAITAGEVFFRAA